MSLEIELENFGKTSPGKDFEEIDYPEFADYEPDLENIKNAAEEHDPDTLVVIGNGGSITSFRAYYYAFREEVDTEVEIVTTQDPDLLNRIGRNTSPGDTLVMPVSKSGSTTSMLEATLYFLKRGYPIFAVTSDSGPLRQIIERGGHGAIEHPDVGGRFSGATETALVPAAFAGLDVEELRRGAEKIYGKFRERNAAWEMARVLQNAESEGFTEILAPFYSTRMFGFYPLLVQLMHETVCKEGRGQTVYGDLGPEIQHHTNQRLFGGRENVVPVFFRTEAHEHEKISVPESFRDIGWKDRSLGDLHGKEVKDLLESEYLGVRKELEQEDRPFGAVSLLRMDYSAAGELLAFLQFLAVYSAELRGVNPYNQPEVEKSKELGFEQRFK
ncbi:MAG: hypothetical protein ABEJ75_00645 [Candidatus Nanohaloarchaea archaeon]